MTLLDIVLTSIAVNLLLLTAHLALMARYLRRRVLAIEQAQRKVDITMLNYITVITHMRHTRKTQDAPS